MWFFALMGLLPVVAATKGSEDGNTKDVASIKQKKRSLNGHKLQLGNHIRDCRSRIAHYKAVKSTEAKEMIN